MNVIVCWTDYYAVNFDSKKAIVNEDGELLNVEEVQAELASKLEDCPSDTGYVMTEYNSVIDDATGEVIWNC